MRPASRNCAPPCCPVCRTPVAWADNPARPFRSIRCQLIDLGGWLDEVHRIPGDAPRLDSVDHDPAAGDGR